MPYPQTPSVCPFGLVCGLLQFPRGSVKAEWGPRQGLWIVTVAGTVAAALDIGDADFLNGR